MAASITVHAHRRILCHMMHLRFEVQSMHHITRVAQCSNATFTGITRHALVRLITCILLHFPILRPLPDDASIVLLSKNFCCSPPFLLRVQIHQTATIKEPAVEASSHKNFRKLPMKTFFASALNIGSRYQPLLPALSHSHSSSLLTRPCFVFRCSAFTSLNFHRSSAEIFASELNILTDRFVPKTATSSII